MKKTAIVPLLLVAATIVSVGIAPAADAAWFKTFQKPRIVRLKKPTAFGAIAQGEGVAMNTISARPMAAPMMGGGMTAGVSEPAVVDSKMMMPAPYPGSEEEYTQVEVDYNWSITLPDTGINSDVYHAIRAKPDLSATRSILRNAGLPSGIIDSMNELESLNASWRTKDGLHWSADVVNGNISWWKETQYPYGSETAPKLDKEKALRVAQEFVKVKGLGQYATTKPELENAPWIQYLTGDAAQTSVMPCPYVKEMPVTLEAQSTSGSAAVSDAAPERSMIAPPCFWYPRTVNIVYPDVRDGKKVTDAWSGYPQQAMTITVSLDTYEVTGGWINVPTSVEASSYPLVDKSVVEAQLRKGGRAPMYHWGKKGTRAQVQYTSFESVLMRYDSWKDGKNETYFVPALQAIGTVDRGDGQGLTEYRTIVPLIKAEFLDEGMNPITIMNKEGVVPAITPLAQ